MRAADNNTMPNIELSDLKNKPFLDVEEPRAVPTVAYVALVAEVVATFQIYYSYEHLVLSYPLLAPTLLGAASAALAQTVTQFMKHKYSTNKLLKFLVWGCINGCFTALWIDVLVSRVENIFYRVLLDQTVGAPCFQLIFSVLSSLWEDTNAGTSAHTNYLRSLRYSYCYWPFVSVTMFAFIPSRMMFFANCIANFVWNVILSKLS